MSSSNTVRIFLAGSTKRHSYTPASYLLESIRISLDNELRSLVERFGSPDAAKRMPTLAIDTASSSYDQAVLDERIANADLALFFLTENEMPGTILQREMETAVGSFIRRGKPYPYLLIEQGDEGPAVPAPELTHLLDKCGFMQYRVAFGRGGDTELYAAVARIVLARVVERLFFEEKALLAHVPRELRAESRLESGGDTALQLLSSSAYVCGRLRYTEGFDVGFKEVDSGTPAITIESTTDDERKRRHVAMYLNEANIMFNFYEGNGDPVRIKEASVVCVTRG